MSGNEFAKKSNGVKNDIATRLKNSGINDTFNEGSMNNKKIKQRPRLVKGKFLCVITGAGNGLGRAIANLVFQEGGIHPLAMGGSRLILIDKDMDSLRETSGKKMKQFLKHRKIEVELFCVDLSDLSKAREFIEETIIKFDKDFEEVILINNITTLGDTTKTLSLNTNFEEIKEYFDLNIISKTYMTAEVCNEFALSKKTVINTMNYDASRPNAYLGLPYMASSAIKAFSEVFAKENLKTKVLVFTPGRVDSGSSREILEKCSNKELIDEIGHQVEMNQLKQPLEIAKKLAKILDENKFKSGVALVSNENDDSEK